MDKPALEPLRPPIVILGVVLIVVRGATLLLGQISGPSWPPLRQILFGQLFSAGEASLLVGGGLVVWKLLPPFRAILNLAMCLAIPTLIFVSQVDFFLFLITGDHLTPSVLRQFVGPGLFESNNFWEPVRAHAFPIVSALTVVGLTSIGAVVLFWRRGRAASGSAMGWKEIALWCGVGALTLTVPITFGEMGEAEEPVEVLYLEEILGMEGVRLASEERAFRELRDFVGLPPGRVWMDDRYPLVHGPDPAVQSPPLVEHPPDIFVILIESMRAQCFDFISEDHDGCKTPYLERMARSGVLFPHHISNGFPSSEGFIAVTTSSWPHHRKRVLVDFNDIVYDSVPQRLSHRGYYTIGGETHGGFDGVGLWYDKFFDQRIDLVQSGLSGSDRLLFQIVRDQIEEHDAHRMGRPLYVQIKTDNPHLPYGTPTRIDGKFDEDGTLLENYIRTMKYVDDQIGNFIDWLETRSNADNMVVIVTGDHANYLDQKGTTSLPLDDTAWVGAWLYGPERLVGPPRRMEEHTSHVDIGPTLLALAGDHRPTAFIGRDLLGPSRGVAQAAVMVRPGGLRMDRNDRSLVMDRKRPGLPIDYPAFRQPLERADATTFERSDLTYLWNVVMTHSYLIENDRMWSPMLFDPSGSARR